jgi:hypothetical protein
MRIYPLSFFVLVFFISSSLIGLLMQDLPNVFLVDKYAKRVGFFLSGLAFLFICLVRPEAFKVKKKYFIYFCILVAFYFFLGAYFGSPSDFILTEAIQLCFIFIIACLARSFPADKHGSFGWVVWLSVMAALFVGLGIKLQFSYAGFLAALLLLCGFRTKSFILDLFLLLVAIVGVVNSLMGKSVFFMLLALIVFTARFRFVLSKDFYKAICYILVACMLIVVFVPEAVFESGLYRKSLGFFLHLNIGDSSFDMSTAQRILEGDLVIQAISNSGFMSLVFGNGLGGSIDLSSSLDTGILKTHENLEQVRNIHLLFFYLLLKFGFLGVLGVYWLAGNYLLLAYRFFYTVDEWCDPQSSIIKTLILYVVMIFLDGQFSAGHMLSNPLFFAAFFLTYRIMKERNLIVVLANPRSI